MSEVESHSFFDPDARPYYLVRGHRLDPDPKFTERHTFANLLLWRIQPQNWDKVCVIDTKQSTQCSSVTDEVSE